MYQFTWVLQERCGDIRYKRARLQCNSYKIINMEEAKEVKIKLYDVTLDYDLIDKVGCGTYGTVFKAYSKRTGDYVAIKKIQNKEQKLQAEGFPITALRQISLLKMMRHPNIVKLREIIVSKPNKRNLFRGSTFLVFEYVEHDFAGLFKNKMTFPLNQIKCLMKQILEGVAYLHRERILHRDLKSANLLMSASGRVKIADFGLGRRCKPDPRYTSKVVTLWYRAPQLLMGVREYSTKIDMWSVGCIFVQFFIHDVLFKKDREYDQIERIFDVCGGVEENCLFDKNMAEVDREKMYQGYKRQTRPRPEQLAQTLKNYNSAIDESTISFIKLFLQLNPSARISAEEALNHEYFSASPCPCEPHEISQFSSEYHDFITKKISERPQQKDSDYKYPIPKRFENQKAPYRERDNRRPKDEDSRDRKGNNYARDHEERRESEVSKGDVRDHEKRSHREYQSKEGKDREARENDRHEGYRESRGERGDRGDSGKDREREKDKERQKQKQKDRERERERQKERERERERDREREREKERDRERQKQRERERQKERDRDRDRDRNDKDRQKDRKRHYSHEKERDNYRDTSRQKDSRYKDSRENRKVVQSDRQARQNKGYIKDNRDTYREKEYSRDQRHKDRTPERRSRDRDIRSYRQYRERRHSREKDHKYSREKDRYSKERDQKPSREQGSEKYYQKGEKRSDNYSKEDLIRTRDYKRQSDNDHYVRGRHDKSYSRERGYSRQRSRSKEKPESSYKYSSRR